MHLFGPLAALLCAMSLPAQAGDSWDTVRAQLFPDRPLLDGTGVIAIDAPYRTPDDARTDIAAQIRAPDGLRIGKVVLVLDENPMPVSAVFDLLDPQPRFLFDVTMRINGPTPLHVVAETTDGRLWMGETFVKTSGLGACAAPPGTDPELALASLGRIELRLRDGAPDLSAGGLGRLAAGLDRLEVDISHPSHSGMQMDQISLLFIPMRYVETVDIDLDGAGYVDVTGSISLSENPHLALSVPRGTGTVAVTMTDTDGTVSSARTAVAGY